MSDLNFNTPFDPFHSTQYNFLNLTGQRCYRWTVVSIYGRDKYQNVMWLCLCECKNWGLLTSAALRKRSTHSCGCFAQEQKQGRSVTHGEAGVNITPEYRAYQHAKTRCTNPKQKGYVRYGGRGIEFRFTSFEEFLVAVGRRPTPHHSLDRFPDMNGHYEKGNLRWATATEQARNTRRNHSVTINDETKCLAEWCVHYNINPSTVQQRIKAGWPEIEAITRPLRNKLV